ncbi:MAG: homoserine dehydrogenase [Alphaproteobacteria bacterium TMED93]|nr:MAG: homoserine dehydrogenase [Alphaproteobacteria bacterium TMED93]
MSIKKIGIGIVGLGTVGSGLIEIIQKNNNSYKSKYNLDFSINGISAKNKKKKRNINIKNYKWFNDPIKMTEFSDIDIIVELVGGSDGLALKLAEKSLINGKYFVTANKALIAKHGIKILDLSIKYNSKFSFEAAVGGGIPIIRLMQNSMIVGKIKSVYGILNGTCNYILTKMRENNLQFNNALKKAQQLGFAEANPEDDINGVDTAYKLAILSNLAFGITTKVSEIFTEGISKIEEIDIKMAEKLGYKIVLLGISNLKNNKVMQRVHPSLVSNNSMISKVNNELNTIIIDDEIADKIMVVGKGAGKKPTSASVMADILNINDENKKKFFVSKSKKANNLSSQDISKREGKFYIRMGVDDKPGVLADITLFFKKQKISIKSMFQLDDKVKNIVPLIFVTHKVTEKKISLVLKKMDALKKIKTKIVLLRIEEL